MGDQSAYMPSPGSMPKKSGGGGGGGAQQSSFISSLFVAAAISSSSRQAQPLRLAMRRHRLVETSRPTCELLGRGKLRDRNLKK
uniref:Uncharacterized protein n=1 Tax=Meloidogyne incognita TaxID=6306 RepID=A0A914MJG1_MELIC